PDVAGRYFVRVVAVSGASTYVLSIDDDVASLGLPRRAKRLTDPFVAGEVLMTQSRRAMPKRYGIRPAHAGRGMRLEALDRAEPAAPGPTLPEVALPAGAAISPAALARYQTLLAARQLGARKDVEV